jgi:hypothetical protein
VEKYAVMQKIGLTYVKNVHKKRDTDLKVLDYCNLSLPKSLGMLLELDFFKLLLTLDGGNTYILSFTVLLSKWVELFAVKRGTEDEVALVLIEEIIC